MSIIVTEGCGWLDHLGDECGSIPEGKITLRDRLVAGKVLVCGKHLAEYNRNAAATRVSAKPKPPRNKDDWSTPVMKQV